MQENNNLLAEINKKRNLLNKDANSLSRGKINAFEDITIKTPDLRIPIHGFYTCISWLYVTYYESGSLTIKFLSERAIAYGLDDNNTIEQHRKVVHNFRTILQHNINRGNREDIAKEHNCYRWLKQKLSQKHDTEKYWPVNEDGWKEILTQLLEEAYSLFDICHQALVNIQNDEFTDDIINIWITRSSINFSKVEWENVLSNVAKDLGLEYLRLSEYTNKHLQKWNKQIATLKDGFDFDFEARRIIELSIINDDKLPLPITGDDIITEFNISPGPRVREYLKKAQEIFLKSPCDKTRLLEKLKDH